MQNDFNAESTQKTYIYAYSLITEQGKKSGRVEAADHRQAQNQAIRAVGCEVYRGNIKLLENQELARRKDFVALNLENEGKKDA
ncbi:hypothetical protein [Acinetobacter sp. 1000160]|uniref:hypothetical protein n=1 Tax=Acinetobacter sp. 1000160 TaxID=1310800 RepID=UPI000452099C|nr:hypothetical protein [Acinetobacter sp. 1000160]EYT17832.1 hypothetical protein J699_02768 [Acinetobacter sp. 1000160]